MSESHNELVLSSMKIMIEISIRGYIILWFWTMTWKEIDYFQLMWYLFSYTDGKVAKNLTWFTEEFFLIVAKFCRFLFCRICFHRNIFLGVRDKPWKAEKKYLIQALHTVKQIETSFHLMYSFAKSDIVIYWKGLINYCQSLKELYQSIAFFELSTAIHSGLVNN